MTKQTQTRIVVCKKCGIRTRHQWQRWERRPLLLRATGHAELVEGWVCSKCGCQSSVRQIGVVRVSTGK